MAEPREVDFEFPRGDTFVFGFQLVDANKTPLNFNVGDAEIYFTVKRNENTSDVIFQKKFSTGGILRDEEHDGYYYATINPSDTNSMKYGSYGFDVEVKIGDYVATQIIGTMSLTKEYTHNANE
jgi:hypothetical protein